MQAALYAGRFDRVTEIWPGLPRSWWSLYALDVGRAYLHAGIFTEAEHHLRLARNAQQAFFMNSDMQAQHNLLTWMLAGFYLAQLLEKTGRRYEALAYYEEFVKHFESSAAALPQIAASQAVLTRMRLSERGKLVFSDEFSGKTIEAGKGLPRWQVADAAALKLSGNIVWQGRHMISYHDAIFELSFRINEPGRISLSLGSERGPLARVAIEPRQMTVEAAPGGASPGLERAEVDKVLIVVEPEKHKVVFDARKAIAQLDETFVSERAHLDVDKKSFALSTRAVSFDYIGCTK